MAVWHYSRMQSIEATQCKQQYWKFLRIRSSSYRRRCPLSFSRPISSFDVDVHGVDAELVSIGNWNALRNALFSRKMVYAFDSRFVIDFSSFRAFYCLLVGCVASFSFNLRIEMNFNLIKCIVEISVLHISNGICVPASERNWYVEVFWCWRLHEFSLWAKCFVGKLIKAHTWHFWLFIKIIFEFRLLECERLHSLLKYFINKIIIVTSSFVDYFHKVCR